MLPPSQSNLDLDGVYMGIAYQEALKAYKKRDVPIGAIAVKDGVVLARAHNQKESKQSPSAHAELLVLEKAAKKLGTWRLLGVTVYSTVEPCPMCAGAMLQSRISRLVYGVPDIRWGAVESIIKLFDGYPWNHTIAIKKGFMEEKIESLLKTFFEEIRIRKNDSYYNMNKNQR